MESSARMASAALLTTLTAHGHTSDELSAHQVFPTWTPTGPLQHSLTDPSW